MSILAKGTKKGGKGGKNPFAAGNKGGMNPKGGKDSKSKGF